MDINDRRRRYPQDLLQNLPPKQEGKTVKNTRFSAFALSLQGASHVQKGVPCQDYSDVRILDESKMVIGGIADGVGSCPLSHWGAYIAVSEALDYVEDRIRNHERAVRDEELYEILNKAFLHAEDMVAKAADAAAQAVRNLQSTLTVAVYDGSNLYCCHVGDDGVVAQQQNGIVKLATKRLKGEEASSVYPLQTGKWEITKVGSAVAGFVMATDGILDAFAMMYPDYNNINYSNRIYYPFMESAMYGMLEKTASDAAKKTLAFYKQYLNSPKYRAKVTDDLTLVAVTAPAVLAKSVRPEFNVDTWNAIEEENERRKAEALGYAVPKKKPAAEPLLKKELQKDFEYSPELPRLQYLETPNIKSDFRPAKASTETKEEEKKNYSRRCSSSDTSSSGSDTFLLTLIGIVIALLIAAIAAAGFLYAKKFPKIKETQTAEAYETNLQKEMPSAISDEQAEKIIGTKADIEKKKVEETQELNEEPNITMSSEESTEETDMTKETSQEIPTEQAVHSLNQEAAENSND